MTERASKKKSSRKTSQKESRYYTVNSMKELTRQMAEWALKYNEKLVTPSLEAVKETLELLRKDPGKGLSRIKEEGGDLAEQIRANVDKKVHGWVAQGKDLVKELAENPREVAGDYLKESRKWTDETMKAVRRVIENLVDDGKTVVTEVRSDPKARAKELIQAGKKSIEALPGVEKVEEKVEKTVHRLAASLKLSSRTDMEKLADTVEKLDKKVDELSERVRG